MTSPLLKLENIHKSFGKVSVLEDIGLSLNEGEILFLLGASGCGKTTLLRIIAGFESANQGSMYIHDKSIFGSNHFVPPRKRHLGYVLQEGVLFPHLNVYRNIAYGIGNGKGKSKKDKQRIEQVMQLTEILDLAKRLPHEISGGQQQRVALARALAPNPKIMLLDEPFSGLDEHLRAQIRDDVIEILRRSNSTAIIVTHDRHEALSCADKVGLIHDGQLMQLDTPQNIYQRPCNPQMARFINESNILLDGQISENERSYCANCRLAQQVPVDILPCQHGQLEQCPLYQDGQVLIRSDQLVPTKDNHSDSLLTASVERVMFYGQHCRVDMISGDTNISLNLKSDEQTFKVGDKVGLKMIGKGVFYPQDLNSK